MNKTIAIAAALSGGLAVALGAFGAHMLRALLEQHQKLDTFLTASRYHFYHSLALLAVALLFGRAQAAYLQMSAWAFGIGIFLFCGSLYVLSLTGYTKLGMVAPFGGIGLIAGWLLLAAAVYKGV